MGESNIIKNVISGHGANISGNNNHVDAINSNNVTIALPKTDYQKIIRNNGLETTIETHGFTYVNNDQDETEISKLRKYCNNLQDEVIKLQQLIIKLILNNNHA